MSKEKEVRDLQKTKFGPEGELFKARQDLVRLFKIGYMQPLKNMRMKGAMTSSLTNLVVQVLFSPIRSTIKRKM
jgi:hypothetical protein